MLREQVDRDFELAMAARRTEAMNAVAEQAAKAEAEQQIRQARAQAQAILADTRRRWHELRDRRARVAAALRSARRLLDEAEPLLRPPPEESEPGGDH